MQGTIPAERRKLIERIAGAAKRRRRKGEPIAADRFIRQYYRGVAEEDLDDYAAADLAASALGHLRFGSLRSPSEPLIRVYNADSGAGSASAHTSIEIVLSDMPFLVDSVGIVLARAGLAIHLMVHPVLRVRRDRRGRLLEIAETDENDKNFVRESWQRIEVDCVADAQRREQLQSELAATLADVHAAVVDWRRMRQRALATADQVAEDTAVPDANDAREAAALLRWMEDNHFTFLGYREYQLRRGRSEDVLIPIAGSGLGLLRPRRGQKAEPTRLTGELRKLARAAELLTITKANSLSTVHRAAYLDYVGIKTFDRRGRVIGEKRFLGLFTSAAYIRSPRDIPLLRHKIQRVIAHFGLDPASHDGKAVEHVLETYPRDELFQASIADLIRIVRGIVNLYERHRVRVFLRRDAFGRFLSALIYVPRDRYNTQVRERIEAVVRQRLATTAVDSQVQISDSALARVHLIAHVAQQSSARIDVAALEQQIAATVRTWHDRLRDALIARDGEARGRAAAERYLAAFPAAYEEDVDPAAALPDLQLLDEVVEDGDRIAMRLARGEGSVIELRLFRSAAPIPLSQALPVLENMGFTVISEHPYRMAVGPGRPIWLQVFHMRLRDGKSADTQALSARFTDAFLAVWNGLAENDGFNRLLTLTDLEWRQAMVLRAYCRFILQTGTAFSQAYMEQVLTSNAPIAAVLYRLFHAQFDPALSAARRDSLIGEFNRELARLLDAVASLDEDRILRRFASVIQRTLRTNYFQADDNGAEKSYLAVKLDSRNLSDLPQPRPQFEIFVYSPRVEGVHLRMGHVARGGIRWSDRREDFRTEVLGLMKAQNVKNTLIVPVGAKGGFVPKRIPPNASREDVQREGVECYRTFIRGLLDLTDNIVGGRIAPPPLVVRRDGDDAYLVVAADKGTATFSDIANRIAAEYGFWLGDAFASGGSAGYDHKKMGITARGAWECVKRHCRESGLDIQSQDFTVVGIGDMSGDVFGNGMLQSPHIRLLAAFNHQHIFLDPAPDAAASFQERKRLFALPRSTWQDYDSKLISRGGGVFARSAKSIKLSPQVQGMLNMQRDSASPPELIRALLCLPVDLLWNGGIGTYVKASTETHLEVGDRSNDSVRIDGADLRCKVVGEGGNLGFTQRGRIEYALRGGRINTDFVDNSGGVDCSDHEVNIKILFNSAPPRAGWTLSRRNKLLQAMTEEVAALVLRDNYMQSQALSMLEARAIKDLLEHAHSIRSLELSGHLDRTLEFLPAAEEIAERHKAGHGLTRPELAILLAYAKMALYSRLIDSDVPEDPYLGHELERYFPARMQRSCASFLHKHRLRREIIATATTNSMVNRMGATFARRAQEDTGANAASVVRAYAIARESFQMRAIWSAIEALDNRIDAATQYEMMFETTRLLRFCTYWLIHRHAQSLNIEAQVLRLRPGLATLTESTAELLSGADLALFEERRKLYRAAQVPDALAKRMAAMSALRSGPDAVEIAAQTKLPIETAAKIYFQIGAALSLDWIREQIERLGVDGHWQAVARTTLRDNIYNLQRTLCLQALQGSPGRKPTERAALWIARHEAAIDHIRQTVTDMRTLPVIDFATLSVALQAVRRVAEGSG